MTSCSSGEHSAADGVMVFGETVALGRGERLDRAQRELPVDRDGIFVVIAHEDDADVKLHVFHDGLRDIAPASVEVESFMLDAGMEIAVLDAPSGTRLKIELTGPRDFEQPRRIPLEVFRYEGDGAKEPRAAARIAAMRAWSAATDATLTGADIEKKSIPGLDFALDHLESDSGDPRLAAWGRMLRSRFNYRRLTDLRISLADARRAEKAFTALGEARHAARAKFLEAAALLEITTDASAKDPSADEAGRETTDLLTALREEPSLSAFERARSVGYLGAHYFNLYKWAEARATWSTALSMYEKIGYRHGRRQVLINLGVVAADDGDYRGAARFFDRVMPEIDEVGVDSQRILILFNAAAADTFAGNTDRAIDRLLQAQAVARRLELKQYESLLLFGLGRAYWVRGDLTQASTLLTEALKLRRVLDGGVPLLITLRANGALARDMGNIEAAIAMHREFESLSLTNQSKLQALMDQALDHAAGFDYERAIVLCRQALALPQDSPAFHKRFDVQLVLANALLSKSRRSAEELREAAALIQEGLGAAIRRADTTLELWARRLLAQSLVARREYRRAREEYERAISLIFKYRSTIPNPELRAIVLNHEQKTFRGYVDLLMLDVARREPGRLLPATAAEVAALRTLEWARALKTDAFADSRLDTATQARVVGLLEQMAGKRVRIAALLDREKAPARALELLQLDIAQLRAEVDRLRAASSRESAGMSESSTVSEEWPALPKEVTQLSYALETEHPYLWVRDAAGIRTAKLATRSETIAADLKMLAEATRAGAPAKWEAVLARLSRVLLPADALIGNFATLQIVADGTTTRIPFAALTSQRRPIVMITSMFAVPELAPAARPHALRFAALVADARPNSETAAAQVFPALQGSSVEARSIAALFEARDPASPIKLMLGAEGSASNLKRIWHDGVDVIHFATHGLADLRQPLTSLLLLPAVDQVGSPTYLTAGQVQEWRGHAELVFLSACDTAVGNGMQGAFLRAGARGVIATLWPVEDVYASQFATDFYRRYTAGMPASQALSETQRGWMTPAPGIRRSEQAYRQMTAWAHAYYAQ